MEKTSLLILMLGVSVAVYVLYRHTFLKAPKKSGSKKPPFTLKIETE